MAFDQPARMGLVPSVVPQTHVTNAVALMSATQNAMRILGAASGGVLYAVVRRDRGVRPDRRGLRRAGRGHVPDAGDAGA